MGTNSRYRGTTLRVQMNNYIYDEFTGVGGTKDIHEQISPKKGTNLSE
jgi:hypothetical protein